MATSQSEKRFAGAAQPEREQSTGARYGVSANSHAAAQHAKHEAFGLLIAEALGWESESVIDAFSAALKLVHGYHTPDDGASGARSSAGTDESMLAEPVMSSPQQGETVSWKDILIRSPRSPAEIAAEIQGLSALGATALRAAANMAATLDHQAAS